MELLGDSEQPLTTALVTSVAMRLAEENVELRADRDKLIDETHMWESKLRESREYAEDLSGACELLDGVNEELRKQVDELTAERDELKAVLRKLRETVGDGCSS